MAPRTLVEAARRHARERGDRLAYLLLEDGDTEGPRLTFSQFDQAAQRIAAGLLQHARPGDRALLVYESGLDFLTAFFGCLYAGIIAVPSPAPEANRRGSCSAIRTRKGCSKG
jgi:acyl-CoA synthetase (AMP-forming)/AMP-acid ligase II